MKAAPKPIAYDLEGLRSRYLRFAEMDLKEQKELIRRTFRDKYHG